MKRILENVLYIIVVLSVGICTLLAQLSTMEYVNEKFDELFDD
jgi:hypothetical protein